MKTGKQAKALRADGYVTASEVARATERDLSNLHKDIRAKKIPGRKIGWGWYVDIHGYADAQPYPADTVFAKALEDLRKLVAKRADGTAIEPSFADPS